MTNFLIVVFVVVIVLRARNLPRGFWSNAFTLCWGYGFAYLSYFRRFNRKVVKRVIGKRIIFFAFVFFVIIVIPSYVIIRLLFLPPSSNKLRPKIPVPTKSCRNLFSFFFSFFFSILPEYESAKSGKKKWCASGLKGSELTGNSVGGSESSVGISELGSGADVPEGKVEDWLKSF